MQTNAQVAAAFVRGETAHNRSMRSDGDTLYSYATPIAYHSMAEGGRPCIIVSTQQHSVTTTRHHSELWKAAHGTYDGPSRYDEDADRVQFALNEGRSDPESPAVVWRKLTPEEREAKDQESRAYIDRLLREAMENQGISMEEYHRRMKGSATT